MSKEIIAKAAEIIKAKTGYVGGGMEGYATIALIDENGYPVMSTKTIAHADGIKWLTFNTSPDANASLRIGKCNRASVCINSSEYHISLVGTFEVATDSKTKNDNWFAPLCEMWSGPDDPNFCVLHFTTESYNIFIAEGDSVAQGTLEGVGEKPAVSKASAVVEPIIQFDRQCEQAIELYKKAFGAQLSYQLRYSDANPADRPAKYDEKDANFIFHAQMMIGSQRILLCDNLFNELPQGHTVSLVVTFKTADEVRAAFDVLADGGTIVNPLSSATYCVCCGSLIDRFGVSWELMA